MIAAEEVPFCAACSKPVPRASRHCPHCGRAVERGGPALEPGPLALAAKSRMPDPPPFPMQEWNGLLVSVGLAGTVQVHEEGVEAPVVQEGLSLDGDLSAPPLILEGLVVACGATQASVFDLAARAAGRSVEPARAQRLVLGGPLTSAAATDGRSWLAAPVRVGDRCEVRVWRYRPRRGFEPRPTLRPAGGHPGQDLHVWMAGGRLFAGREGDVLTGWDLDTGEMVESLAVPGGLKFSPVVRDGPVPLVRSTQEALFRLPLRDGQALSPVFSSPGESLWTWAEGEGALWVVAGSHLYRVDPRGGEHRLPLRESGGLSPALAAGGAFVLTPGGWLSAVRWTRGQLEQAPPQRLYEGTAARSGGPMVIGRTLAAVDPEGTLTWWRAA